MVLRDMSLGGPINSGPDAPQITTSEVETPEALIGRPCRRLAGVEPSDAEWEPMYSYCSGNEKKLAAGFRPDDIQRMRRTKSKTGLYEAVVFLSREGGQA